MVRVNIIEPWRLTDQHLVAEYLEIMMLIGSVKKNRVLIEEIPESYRLGKGHINFFKNKLVYLKNRHEKIKEEMRKRNFKTNVKLMLNGLNNELMNDWTPSERDKKIIKKRIEEKINMKNNWYRYYGEVKDNNFLIALLNN